VITSQASNILDKTLLLYAANYKKINKRRSNQTAKQRVITIGSPNAAAKLTCLHNKRCTLDNDARLIQMQKKQKSGIRQVQRQF